MASRRPRRWRTGGAAEQEEKQGGDVLSASTVGRRQTGGGLQEEPGLGGEEEKQDWSLDFGGEACGVRKRGGGGVRVRQGGVYSNKHLFGTGGGDDGDGKELQQPQVSQDSRNVCGIPWNWSRIHHHGKSFLDMAGRSLSCSLSDPKSASAARRFEAVTSAVSCGHMNGSRSHPHFPVTARLTSSTSSDSDLLSLLVEGNMIAHVGDFGLARFRVDSTASSLGDSISTPSIAIKGTIEYVAPEYASGGQVSIVADVYSFGIVLLEIFLRKRPIDDMFKDGLNIANFVEMNFPDKILQIVDPVLLQDQQDFSQETPVAMKEKGS